MFNQNLFAQRIKELRLLKGQSQEELGNIIGVTKTQISDIERAKRLTNIIAISTLAHHFNVSIDYLIGNTDDPRRH